MPQSDQCKTWKRNFHKQKSYDFFHEACRYGVLYRLDYGGVSRGGFRQCLAILVTNCEKSIQHSPNFCSTLWFISGASETTIEFDATNKLTKLFHKWLGFLFFETPGIYPIHMFIFSWKAR